MKKLMTIALLLLAGTAFLQAQQPVPEKPRVLISTDVGGTDPDDNQSVAHMLMYTDKFDTEGLVSSPSYGSGSKEELLRMIDLYEKDFRKLKRHFKELSAPDYLRSICKQGRKGAAPYCGYMTSTEGSDWIIECARREDKRPCGCWCGEDLMMWHKPCTMRLTSRTASVSIGLEDLTRSGA